MQFFNCFQWWHFPSGTFIWYSHLFSAKIGVIFSLFSSPLKMSKEKQQFFPNFSSISLRVIVTNTRTRTLQFIDLSCSPIRENCIIYLWFSGLDFVRFLLAIMDEWKIITCIIFQPYASFHMKFSFPGDRIHTNTHALKHTANIKCQSMPMHISNFSSFPQRLCFYIFFSSKKTIVYFVAAFSQLFSAYFYLSSSRLQRCIPNLFNFKYWHTIYINCLTKKNCVFCFSSNFFFILFYFPCYEIVHTHTNTITLWYIDDRNVDAYDWNVLSKNWRWSETNTQCDRNESLQIKSNEMHKESQFTHSNSCHVHNLWKKQKLCLELINLMCLSLNCQMSVKLRQVCENKFKKKMKILKKI